MTYDRDFWEERWSEVPPSRATERPPNAHLRAEVEDLRPGRALDAGCGHGSDALWLAARGWQVTGVDFSATALAHAPGGAPAIRSRSPSTTRSPRSIPIAGRSSSRRTARGPRRAPASTP